MRRSFFIGFMISCIVFIFAGCTQNNEEGKKDEKTTEKVSIMLDWYPNAVHSAIYTAVEKGYFTKEGIDVDIKMPAETNDPLRLVAAGKVDLAISYQPQVVVSRAEGIPVVSLAAFVRHPLDHLMVPETSHINSPKDLEGKNIGYSSIEIEEAILNVMVNSDGGDYKKVNMIDVGWDLIPAISTEKVDGIIGGYINHERVLLEKEGHPMITINPVDFGVPDYYELVLVASEKGLKENEELFKRFWKAVSKGQKDVTKDPKGGLNILLGQENESFPLDQDVETESLNVLLPLMNDDELPFGYQDEAVWAEVANWLFDTGIVKEKIDVKDAYMNLVDKND
ncbi:ABC transporter substrate-binding protein [Bacillus aquiflavi]|uniref:ABC transporter substrate-binding protein n=1 Tax=Bacillus aquiflavi TaxID=2672567 RepID=A0A6B3VY71_9BACI|nr:ABC transporter substrate-binding protein [Bacillus aquiflavi]MBA4537992.1 ABC transporter substrate-binding protein [Bacillus aquiflavi]NEY82248.1 ABC transporter substrate-binding protein [Bacillus aquiflavi]